jgi:hypothetical protein
MIPVSREVGILLFIYGIILFFLLSLHIKRRK